MKSDWEKTVERKTSNIGFVTKVGGLREWTIAEKTAALYKEIESWQKTKGTKPYKVSAEYPAPHNNGIHCKGVAMEMLYEYVEKNKRAGNAYLNTQMDPYGILKNQGIDVSQYEKTTFFKRIKRKIIAANPGFFENFWFWIAQVVSIAAIAFLLWVITFYGRT